jgi:hypothetical protein
MTHAAKITAVERILRDMEALAIEIDRRWRS